MIHPTSPDTTSVPVQIVSTLPFGGTCLSGPLHKIGLSISVRRARQACPSDFPFEGTHLSRPSNELGLSKPIPGHDRHAPPKGFTLHGGCKTVKPLSTGRGWARDRSRVRRAEWAEASRRSSGRYSGRIGIAIAWPHPRLRSAPNALPPDR